jgi:hypothetical protein
VSRPGTAVVEAGPPRCRRRPTNAGDQGGYSAPSAKIRDTSPPQAVAARSSQ